MKRGFGLAASVPNAKLKSLQSQGNARFIRAYRPGRCLVRSDHISWSKRYRVTRSRLIFPVNLLGVKILKRDLIFAANVRVE